MYDIIYILTYKLSFNRLFYFYIEHIDDSNYYSTELCNVQIDRSPMTIVENNEPKPVAERLLFIIVAWHC